MTSSSSLAEQILRQERRALSQAITLAESSLPSHQATAEDIIAHLTPHITHETKRIAISGAPGAGKSSFIEVFGMEAIKDYRVAVLAVDPSSRMGGGAILGDKTRMEQLANQARAYIRPSPSGLSSGGIARGTRAAITLCEAAGFNLILIETVGVGQAETAVYDLVDFFCLLLSPSSGDDLQGVKRGIMELADLIIVNKDDGDLQNHAQKTARDYANALKLIRPAHQSWMPQLITASTIEKKGIQQTRTIMEDFFASNKKHIKDKRISQNNAIFQQELIHAFQDHLMQKNNIKNDIIAMQKRIQKGTKTPYQAAQEIFAKIAK